MKILAASAILPAGASFYFFVFWYWFAFWRNHRLLTYTVMFGTFFALAVAVYHMRALVFAPRITVPVAIAVVGWIAIVGASVFGFVADRQIGVHVRSFGPFFAREGRIPLITTGAYGVVRHPIYAAGIGYQMGVLLVTGYLAVAVALAVFALGALWFTRQEEKRLLELIDDPNEYERYRRRVPALIPWCKPARGS